MQDSFKSWYSQGAGSSHQSFLNPVISPHIISHHRALSLTWEAEIRTQKSPGTLQTAQCFPSWQSRMELTQKWHVWCDRPTKMSCVWTSIPDAMEGSLGRASFIRTSIPLLRPEQKLPLSWGTSSFCRAGAQPADSRTEVHMPRTDHGGWFHSPHLWIWGSQEPCSLLSHCLAGTSRVNCRWVSF